LQESLAKKGSLEEGKRGEKKTGKEMHKEKKQPRFSLKDKIGRGLKNTTVQDGNTWKRMKRLKTLGTTERRERTTNRRKKGAEGHNNLIRNR